MQSRKQKQDEYDRSIKRRYAKAKARARRINRVFTLTFTQYQALLAKDMCTYCEGELEKTGSSLDRIDSRYGYTKKNAVACCWMCNNMKSNLTMEQFLKHIERILKYVKL